MFKKLETRENKKEEQVVSAWDSEEIFTSKQLKDVYAYQAATRLAKASNQGALAPRELSLKELSGQV